MKWNGYVGDEARCRNCGKEIRFEEFEEGEWGWLHPETRAFLCDPDWTATDAEPLDPEFTALSQREG